MGYISRTNVGMGAHMNFSQERQRPGDMASEKKYVVLCLRVRHGFEWYRKDDDICIKQSKGRFVVVCAR